MSASWMIYFQASLLPLTSQPAKQSQAFEYLRFCHLLESLKNNRNPLHDLGNFRAKGGRLSRSKFFLPGRVVWSISSSSYLVSECDIFSRSQLSNCFKTKQVGWNTVSPTQVERKYSFSGRQLRGARRTAFQCNSFALVFHTDDYSALLGTSRIQATKDVTIDEDQRIKFSHFVCAVWRIFGGRYDDCWMPTFV